MKTTLLIFALLTGASLAELPEPSPEKLPLWRGFNLLEKFYFRGKQTPFLEEDFRLIAELGFNFVRLPMDYRGWIRGGDWEQFDENALRQIDEAVEWGGRHGIHVCINFHRAPGYTVAKPPEARDLWTDPEAQRVCAKHWATFARRYRDVPNSRLSFNLLNEPTDIERAKFLSVMRVLVDAIRAEDPKRLIICDGPKWGQVPVEELRELKVASATRGYTPSEISHYGAGWVNSAGFPKPAWPRSFGSNGLLHGSMKKELAQPLTITGPFEQGATLRMHIGIVSSKAHLVVEADGARIFDKVFVCGPGKGEWKTPEFKAQWKTWQNLYDRDYFVKIPQGAARVVLRVLDGDWMEVREIGIAADGASEVSIPLERHYGEGTTPLRWERGQLLGAIVQDGAWLRKECVEPWRRLSASGVGVIVGEWGAFNRTPHEVTLRWAEDSLRNWREAGFGWALWNFRSPFGILDSGRDDVKYEDWHGHQLDREYLNLLLKHSRP